MKSSFVRQLIVIVMVLTGALGSPALVQAREVDAGPIWDNNDAARKCPRVCGAQGWDGNWRTTVPGSMSVCSCGGQAGAGGAAPVGFGTSCQARSTVYCSGCTVSCPAGQQALCTDGEDFGTSGSGVCRTHPKCQCR